jgi:citrate lyase subunit beta/citryl-CoA lyase
MERNPLESLVLPLFVPADRPERFAKAANSGADGFIIDLEDAISADSKAPARQALVGAVSNHTKFPVGLYVRINAVGTPWHEDDLAAVLKLPVSGVIVPKAEHASDLERIAGMMGGRDKVIALVESAAGIAAARAIARVSGRLAFGSVDFAIDMGIAHTREALLLARSELVLASRLAERVRPLDGVTTAIDAEHEVEDDAAYAVSLGFAGKLLIHPKQVIPASRGFSPSASEIAWAERVVSASSDGAAAAVDGKMVDLPVRIMAEQILRRFDKFRTLASLRA